MIDDQRLFYKKNKRSVSALGDVNGICIFYLNLIHFACFIKVNSYFKANVLFTTFLKMLYSTPSILCLAGTKDHVITINSHWFTILAKNVSDIV